MSRRKLLIGSLLAGAVLFASTAAFGLPWDIDMTDAQFVKAYKFPMLPLPEGVVSQPNRLSPKPYERNYFLMDPAVATLQAPFPADEKVLAEGKRMYGIYCTPCHGDGVTVGYVAKKGVPASVLLGDRGVLATKKLSDGWTYLTIRNGSLSTLMPPYGYAMTQHEMWSVVHYMHQMDADFRAAGQGAPQ